MGHSWPGATCTEPDTCTACGETQGEPLGHDWLAATCTDPEKCSRCGELQGQALGHSFADATCTSAQKCTVCGAVYGDPLPHNWVDATCTAPKTCADCGATEGSPLEHNYKAATCVVPATCADCGHQQGELGDHSFAAATCMAPKTCTVCGKTQGEKTAHVWNTATCTKPETCAVCGTTQGEALGHTWADATCETAKTCTVCGATSGSALGHDFADSTDGKTKTCYTCGKNVTIKYVALTFDDGPSGNITRNLLSGLASRGVKVTFFLCGYRIDTYPNLPAEILSGGHEIGLHTDNHEYLTKLKPDEIRQELQGVIDKLPADYNVTLMRPPGGYCDDTVKEICKEMGLSIIMWSVDTEDWATNNASTITNRVVSNAKAGDIILMHDLKTSSVEAALDAIDIMLAQGYEFVTVSQLAKIQGTALNPGQVYHSVR